MRRSHVLLVAAIALTALQGCGSSGKDSAAGDGSAKVASLTSAGAKASASAKAERPRERLDGTPEEFEALLVPYNKCLKEHGATPKAEWNTSAGVDRKTLDKQADKLTEADRVCRPLYYPLPPWEKDPANPEARDFARDVVKCLKNKGVQYVEVGDNGIDIALGGENNDSKSISKGLDLTPGCEREVAAKQKK